jgi:hypothetical protein
VTEQEILAVVKRKGLSEKRPGSLRQNTSFMRRYLTRALCFHVEGHRPRGVWILIIPGQLEMNDSMKSRDGWQKCRCLVTDRNGVCLGDGGSWLV